MIQHHPAPEILADYAAGSMRLSHALCVAAHLEYCTVCRKAVAALEAVGSHYFAELAEVAPGSRQQLNEQLALEPVKASLLDMLDDLEQEPINPALAVTNNSAMDKAALKPTAIDYRIPASLGQFAVTGYDDLRWVSLSPSIKLAVLCRDRDGSQIALTRVKPGGKMPHHAHTGEEITVVLEGAFSDESGLYKQGDMISRNAADKHTPVVTKDAECICLTVLDSPIQFTGFFTRWLNPLLRRQHA